LQSKGQLDEAVACFKRAIAIDPKYATAHYNLGNAMMAKGQLDEAIACYKRANACDPKLAQAHSNLGLSLQSKGQLDEAVACFKRAIACDPKDATAHYNLGGALHDKGQLDEAIACYERAIAYDPKHAEAHNNLGLALQAKGKLDEAIACFKRAIQIGPKFAHAHTNLGVALKAKGQLDEAIACCQRAIACDPKLAQAHGALGHALMQQGQFVESQKSLRRCLSLLAPDHGLQGPVLQLIQQCRQLHSADTTLNAFLAGAGASGDAAVQAQMASLAQQPYRRLYVSSARLYRDAFARQPALAEAHRYNAACAAALAGSGLGKDAGAMNDEQRSTWRRQARDWLAAELARHTAGARKAAGRALVRQKLTHWRQDPDLAGVRDESALAKLPAKEREAWRKLWAEVAELLKTVEQK
jgi:tetratricopeptide (TPR) repeat protein